MRFHKFRCAYKRISAAEKAIRAVQRHESISDDLGMEMLLYASGNRQIKKALSMGIRAGRNNIILAAVGDEVSDAAISELESLVGVADVAGYTHEKRDTIVSFFGITESEIAAVGTRGVVYVVVGEDWGEGAGVQRRQ